MVVFRAIPGVLEALLKYRYGVKRYHNITILLYRDLLFLDQTKVY
jgi:hypothetical protein